MNFRFLLPILFPFTIALGLQAEDPPKRVIVCTTTVEFRHNSIPYGEDALAALDAASPDFEIVSWLRQPDLIVPTPPYPPPKPKDDAPQEELDKYAALLAEYEKAIEIWNRDVKPGADLKSAEKKEAMIKTLESLSPQALRDNRIDAVIFCNTTGPLPMPDVPGFVEWIRNGGAFIGIHAATDTLKGALPYTEMICGIFAGHGKQVFATLHAGDSQHPANGSIGEIWTLSQEEMYLFKNHNREQVRSIWFMRHHPNKPEEKGFFPVAWVRLFGTGKIFYTSLGHNEDMYSIDPALPNRINSVEIASQFRNHLLGGIRWSLGLAEGSAEPNPKTD